jgi:uncharacterized protein YecE (DUF72 family)
LNRGNIAAGLHIGTSGWHYKHWKGNFYPADLPPAQYLAWYMRHFKTVEINNCFYRLPAESAVQNWREQTPKDFCFAVKGSRFITHLKRLLEPEAALRTYLDRVQLLGPKLGPILFQLPPNWGVNLERLEAFLAALPAKKHPYVFEFRDPSWYTDAVYRLLEQYGAALCLHDWRGERSPQELTADFTYIRFHGATGKYQGNYTAAMLESWAEKISDWHRQLRDIYVYFNNDVGGHAIKNALELESRLKAADDEKRCA